MIASLKDTAHYPCTKSEEGVSLGSARPGHLWVVGPCQAPPGRKFTVAVGRRIFVGLAAASPPSDSPSRRRIEMRRSRQDVYSPSVVASLRAANIVCFVPHSANSSVVALRCGVGWCVCSPQSTFDWTARRATEAAREKPWMEDPILS